MHKGQGVKSIVDACDVQALGEHSIKKNRHDSIMEISPWAQERSQKSLPVNTVCHHSQKYRLLYKQEATFEHNPETPSSSLGQWKLEIPFWKT